MAHSGEAAKARPDPRQRAQAHRADHQADQNQEETREAFADQTKIEAHANDPAGWAERDDPLDKSAHRRGVPIVEWNAAQARPANGQRKRQHHNQEPRDDGSADDETGYHPEGWGAGEDEP